MNTLYLVSDIYIPLIVVFALNHLDGSAPRVFVGTLNVMPSRPNNLPSLFTFSE